MKTFYNTNLLNLEDYESLEDYYEHNQVQNNGEYIIDQFYYGNWTDGVNNLKELYVNPREFADFLEEQEETMGFTYDFLDRQAFVTITELFYNN